MTASIHDKMSRMQKHGLFNHHLEDREISLHPEESGLDCLPGHDAINYRTMKILAVLSD